MNLERLAATAAILVVCLPGKAIADPVDWTNSFLLQTSGSFENPLVRIGFNPQPEPPEVLSVLDLGEPTQPFIRVPDAGVSEGNMQILFGIQSPFTIDAIGEPDSGLYSFLLDGGTPETNFMVNIDMQSESGGIPIPGSWVSFNPQPEPPKLGAGPDSIGFEFQFDQTSPAFLSMEILDSGSNPLSFTVVPEPTCVPIFIMALTTFCFRRRKSVCK